MGETGASHNGHYKEYCFLRCDGMYSGRNKAMGVTVGLLVMTVTVTHI
jgi:hypothetical protein